MAVVIKQNWMINPEKSIEAGVQALIERAGPAGRTAKGLASMGFQCVSPQIPQCVYSGHLIRTLSGLPKDTKADPTVRLDIRVETAPDGNAIRVVVTSKETPIGV